jgi:hypothetical protein
MPAISSLPFYYTLLQASVMALNEICVAKQNSLCSHIVP